MTKQTINVGSGEYAGDGEGLRSAFTKTNENFDEVYTSIDAINNAGYLTASTLPPYPTVQTDRLTSGTTAIVLLENGSLTLPEGGVIKNYDGSTYGSSGGLSISDFGRGFTDTLDAGKITTSKLYNRPANLSLNNHFELSVDDGGTVHLPDQSMIMGATLKTVPGNYAGITAGPVGHDEDSWVWVDNDGATIATKYNNLVPHTWTFDNNGYLNLPGGTSYIVGGTNTVNIQPNGLPGSSVLTLSNTSVELGSQAGMELRTNLNGEGSPKIWNFGTDGTLSLPGKLIAQASDNGSISFSNNGVDEHGYIKVDSGYNMVIAADNNVYIKSAGSDRISIGATTTEISASNGVLLSAGSKTLSLGYDGTITLPENFRFADIHGSSVFADVAFIGNLRTHNTVYAGPADGVDAEPTFRNLVAADLPEILISTLTNNSYTVSLETDGTLTLPGDIKSAVGVGPVVIEANDGTARTWTFGEDGGLTFPIGNKFFGDEILTNDYVGDTTIHGNQHITGNLTVDGVFTFTGTATILSVSSATFFGDVNGFNALYAGVVGYTPLPVTVIQVTADYNDYVQNNFQNLNNGITASTEWVATADNGDDTNNYIDMGIASSQWSGAQTNSVGTAAGINDSWVYVQGNTASSVGGNLILGTIKDGKAIKFLAGSNGAASIVAHVESTGFTLNTGTLTFADNTIQTTAWTGTVAYSNVTGTPGVVTIDTSTLVAQAVSAQTATNAAYAYSFNTGTLVTRAVAAQTATNAAYAYSFNTGTLVAQSLTAQQITAASQPNITSVGTLTSLSIFDRLTFSTGSYITGTIAGRDGSIRLEPYTGAGSVFPGVMIGGLGRILAPNGSVHQILNASDVTFQVPIKTLVGNPSTSASTGALQMPGGIGAGADSWFGGSIKVVNTATITSTATSISTTTGALIVTGGAGIGKDVYVGGNVTANKFIGDGSSLTNVTVNVAGSILGTGTNVNLVAGSYTYTFDNTGIVTLPAQSITTGSEGGEIDFTKAPSSTLAGNVVVVDQYADRFRIFEGGGGNRGVYIDLTQAVAGVGTLLNNRVSGFVNSGTYVTMDNIKVTIPTGGNRGLVIAAVSTTFVADVGATYGAVSSSGGASANNVTYTTTPGTSAFGWAFFNAGDTATYMIHDLTNARAYRITIQIGTSYLNNMISIERLV